jgi:HlyD family secretion protein
MTKMNQNRKQRRRRRWILIAIAGGLLSTAILALTAALRPHIQIDPSKLATVTRGDIAQAVVATGKIEPLTKVEVKSKASGIVKKIDVDYGDRVRQGQVLVELDREELRAEVEEARANLAAAQAAEASAVATYQRNQVDAEGPDVPFLKAAVRRDRQLAAAGILAESTLDDAEKSYQLALNKKMSALRSVAVSRADVAKAKAQVEQAQAGLDQAEENLRNATIVSPINGIVLSRNVEVGDAVSSILVMGSQATLVMMLGDVSSVYVKGKVDQADIGKVYVGQLARIVVESFKDKTFKGKVTRISPMGVEKDNVTTFEVRISIQNPNGELKANMSANAQILLNQKDHVLILPESAVIYGKDQKTFVEVPDPRTEQGWKKIPVRLGISNGIQTEVLSGLHEGQQVILQ